MIKSEQQLHVGMFLFDLYDALDIGQIAAGRLLAEYMTALFERIDADVRCIPIRGANKNDIGTHVINRVTIVLVVRSINRDEPRHQKGVANPAKLQSWHGIHYLLADLAHISVPNNDSLHGPP